MAQSARDGGGDSSAIFWLNNAFTFRDKRLRGAAFLRGLGKFRGDLRGGRGGQCRRGGTAVRRPAQRVVGGGARGGGDESGLELLGKLGADVAALRGLDRPRTRRGLGLQAGGHRA